MVVVNEIVYLRLLWDREGVRVVELSCVGCFDWEWTFIGGIMAFSCLYLDVPLRGSE